MSTFREKIIKIVNYMIDSDSFGDERIKSMSGIGMVLADLINHDGNDYQILIRVRKWEPHKWDQE